MKEQLDVLLDSRSFSETKILHDHIKELRGSMMERGIFDSSMHINEAIRICADYFENYGNGALEDYKRAISSDSDKYDVAYLSDAVNRLISRLSLERDAVQGILISNVGGIADVLSNNGLKDYKSFDKTFQSVFEKTKAEAEIFNAKLLEMRPTFLALFKEKWQRNPVIVFLIGTALIVTFLAGFLESIQKIARLFNNIFS